MCVFLIGRFLRQSLQNLVGKTIGVRVDVAVHVIKGTLPAPPEDANPPNADFSH
jgi:hypothetical protein